MDREQYHRIQKDLENKIVILTGPRQVGKTWLARQIIHGNSQALYLNYDNSDDRRIITDQSWLPGTSILVLDEIHKMPQWKQYLKGVYDTKPEQLKIFVTGSARLDTFRQGGESLAGRFFRHRLFPMTPAECHSTKTPCTLDHLMERGGFPEPFLAQNPVDASRWRQHYLDGIIRDDILDFESIQAIRSMKHLVQLLRHRVGAPLSYRSLSEDLQISPNTVKKYVDILEALFIVFRIYPWSKHIARSIQREPKIYFFDTGLVSGDRGIRFENMAALSLYRHACHVTDYQGVETGLYYLRTKDGREVDFCLANEAGPLQMIECKLSDAQPARNLMYFADRYPIPAVQLVYSLRHQEIQKGIEIRDAEAFLQSLIVE